MSQAEPNGVRVHETAEVSPLADIGQGTSVWHQAQIREGARLGRECIVGKGVYVDFNVTIGDRCKLQNGVFVYHPAVIEDGVFLGPGVIITNDKRPRAITEDGRLKSDADWQPSAVHIGSGASVGAGSIILPGVKIGSWAMVGAGSVVTRDVPARGLVLGNPARLQGYVCDCGSRLRRQADGRFHCFECGRDIEIQEGNVDTDC
jgi:UDP-2-acetamido-3-amino-2,3-dideoxy-glucuronate N-acetyltransferase